MTGADVAVLLLAVVLATTVFAGALALVRARADLHAAQQELKQAQEQAAISRDRGKSTARGAGKVGGKGRSRAATGPRPGGRDISSPGLELVSTLTFDGTRPAVVLMLHGIEPAVLFAGIRTAVLSAVELAERLERPLRIVVVAPPREADADLDGALRTLIADDLGRPQVAEGLVVSTAAQRVSDGHHAEDIWVATYWPTAYALASLVREGTIRPERVVYLVQDFEPGFYPWGDLHAKALSTYDAGFRMLVNSASLAAYVAAMTGREPRSEATFAPAIDPVPLRAAADRWTAGPDGVVRVLFYARPSKPRNMFGAGVEALRLWAEALPPELRAVVRFAGEDLDPQVVKALDLGPRAEVEVLGKTTYERYYALLEESDIGLALMLSPHPGHLALELPGAGIPTVTNGFSGYRQPWVEGLTVAGTDAPSIAAGLAEATTRHLALTGHRPGAQTISLGTTLDEAATSLAASLD